MHKLLLVNIEFINKQKQSLVKDNYKLNILIANISYNYILNYNYNLFNIISLQNRNY